ncbi:MAG: hypothetical protein IPN20_00135 [Haliscomenobacter sp.]|nr:hypothetical protein [Haliscomenobacter sp.]
MVKLDQILPSPLPPTTGLSAWHCTDCAAWWVGETPVWKASGSVGLPLTLRRRGERTGGEAGNVPLCLEYSHAPAL